MKVLGFASDHLGHNVKEAGYLVARPGPVLGREGVDCQVGNAELDARFENRAHVVGAGAVTEETGETTLICPAPVAVHDDRNVTWQLVDAWLPRGWQQRCLGHTSSTSCSLRGPGW